MKLCKKKVVRKPKTVDITGFFKKFCIAIRTNKVLKLEWFQDFIFVLKSLVAYQSA